MTIRDLIKDNAAFGCIATIRGEQDIEKMRSYISYNLPVISQFKEVVFAVNWADSCRLPTINAYFNVIKELIPNPELIAEPVNIGHTLGTMQLDNYLVKYCKQNNIKWLFKSTEDVTIESSFLDKEIPEADFYYFNGIGYGGMVKYDFDFDRIIKEDFYPNTNFYIINTEKIDHLYDEEMIEEAFDHISTIKDYSGRIWEYLPGFSCEGKLAEIVDTLDKHHLISDHIYRELLRIVKLYEIHDNSHKNIQLSGVCHFHNPNEGVIII